MPRPQLEPEYIKCGNPACNEQIKLSKYRRRMIEEGKSPTCSLDCRYMLEKVARAAIPANSAICAHTGKRFTPSEWQVWRMQAGKPVFSNPGYARAYHKLHGGGPNEPSNTAHKSLARCCPWESGSMPIAWRVTPIF